MEIVISLGFLGVVSALLAISKGLSEIAIEIKEANQKETK